MLYERRVFLRRFKILIIPFLLFSFLASGCATDSSNIASFGPKVVIEDNNKNVKEVCQTVFETYLNYLEGKSISDEMRITDYQINQIKVEQTIAGNSETKYIFSANYSILPASKRFSLTGSGTKLDNGWIEQKFHVFEITKNKNTYRITGMATGK